MKKHFLWVKPEFLNQSQMGLSDLDTSTQQHLKALRIKEGDLLQFCDSQGHWSLFVVEKKNNLFLKEKSYETPPIHSRTLLLSPPKGEALFEAVHNATQLGVTDIFLFQSARCQLSVTQLNSPSLKSRLERVSAAAAQSAERLFQVNLVISSGSLQSLLRNSHFKKTPHTFLVADETLASQNLWGLNTPLKVNDIAFNSHLGLIIGPEGGFTDDERDSFDETPQLYRFGLGPLVLKVPIAVTVGLTLINTPLIPVQRF